MEKHVSTHDQEIERCTLCWQSDVDTVLGLQWPILEHYHDHKQMVIGARYCALLEEG